MLNIARRWKVEEITSMRRTIWQSGPEPCGKNESTMTSQFAKAGIALLVGFVLIFQNAFPVFASVPRNAEARKLDCCCHGCDSTHCSMPVCCARPVENHAPLAPASPPPTSKNEFQPMATPVVSTPALPLHLQYEAVASPASNLSVKAVPLFQRDCTYLI